MDKIKWKLRNMMSGRNGLDDLGKVTFVASLVLYLISGIVRISLVYLLSCIGLVYTLFRCFSRNIPERRAENQKFQSMLNLNKLKYDQRKEYKIFKCKSCGRNIRVPRKKGKLEITCPVCGTKTIRRT